MKHNILSTLAVAALCIGGMASCSDPDEPQDLALARVLSPTGLDAYVSQRTNIVVCWDAMDGASSYLIEAYDNAEYSGTPVKSITTTALTDTLKNLESEEDFYVRVRANDESDESRNSKWVTAKCTTSPVQYMNKVNVGDIKSTEVKVTWTEQAQFSSIVATPTDTTSSLAPLTFTGVTPSDLAYTLTGLQPETEYYITMKNDAGKTQGYATVTTNMDLSNATTLTVDDNWKSAIEDAEEGTVFALAPGEYDSESTSIKINKSVVLAAANSADRPVLKINNFQMYGGAGLTLNQIVVDGNSSNNYTVDYKEEGTYGALDIKGSEIKNFAKGFVYVASGVNATISNITVNNNIIHEINGNNFIDIRDGYVKTIKLTNSTLYNCLTTSHNFIRVDQTSQSGNGLTVSSTIDHCTLYNVGTSNTATMMFYVRFLDSSNKFTNNVVANWSNQRAFAGTSKKADGTDGIVTGSVSFKNNYYYNCKNLTSKASDNSINTDDLSKDYWTFTYDTNSPTLLDQDPFNDADNADFLLTNERMASKKPGDPRWIE